MIFTNQELQHIGIFLNRVTLQGKTEAKALVNISEKIESALELREHENATLQKPANGASENVSSGQTVSV